MRPTAEEGADMLRRSLLTALVTIGVAFGVVSLLPFSGTTQAQDADPVASIRSTLSSTEGRLDAASAQAVGAALVSRQYALVVLQPPVDVSEAVAQISQDLAVKHVEWQDGKGSGTTEAELIARMNSILEMDKFPEYLRFRPRDARRARVLLRLTMPELRELDKHQATPTPSNRLAPVSMSPFETFMLADYLLYLKSFDDDFLRTTAEDYEAVQKGTEVTRRPAGLSVLPDNPRRGQLELHLVKLAETKSLGVERAVDMMRFVLYGGDK